MQQSPISIIIPTLNEADNIALLFERIYKTLHQAEIPFEIIVIDDHSSDATVALTRSAAPKYHATALIKQGKPGKAFSLLEGFAAAKYDLLCMIDADLQYPPEAIPQMYHKLQYCNADVVITKRIDNKTSRARQLSTGAFHLVFTRLLFGINYDTQSALKLFKRQVLQNMTITPSAWTFDLEFIIRALENNNTILSEDIPFAERTAGVAKLNLFTAAFEGAWQSLKLWRKTSVKRVRLHYQYLKPLQQSFNWLLAIMIGTLLTFSGIGGLTHQASADSSHPLSGAVKRAANDLLPGVPVPPIDDPVPTPPGGSDDPTPTTPPTTTPDPISGSGASNPITTPTTSAPGTASTTHSTGATTNGSTSIGTTAKPTTNTSSTKLVAGSSNLSDQTGKNAPYYPQSKLNSHTTSVLHKASLLALEIGGASLAFGVLLFTIRNLTRKMPSPQSRRQSSFNA